MRLKEYLDEKRITYREFAEMFGVHLQSIKNIAYGTKRASLKLAVQIESIINYKVTTKELLETFDEKQKGDLPTTITKKKYLPKKITSLEK